MSSKALRVFREEKWVVGAGCNLSNSPRFTRAAPSAQDEISHVVQGPLDESRVRVLNGGSTEVKILRYKLSPWPGHFYTTTTNDEEGG